MNRRIRLCSILLSFLIPSIAWSQQTTEQPLAQKSPAERLDGPPIVSAKAWVVADGKMGNVLWGFKETEALAMASTTKIMTARLVLQLARSDAKALDEVIVVSEKAAKTTGTESAS